MKNYQALAKAAGAFHRCSASGNSEWMIKWESQIKEIIDDCFPHGSGFDNGTRFDMDESNDDRLVFHTAFHHMDDDGFYDGWTEHSVIVTPSLGLDYHVKVTGRDGRDRNDIKEYIAECFSNALSEEVKETEVNQAA